MKLLIETINKNCLYEDYTDGVILALKDFSVESIVNYTKEEIADIVNKYNIEVFVSINKNIFNAEIDALKDILLYLDNLSIKGIIFYDLAILQLKKELNLKVDLVWNQTFMVNNYKTCDYYHSKGINYALLGKEITLDEICEISRKSKISTIVEVVSKPTMAFSYRSLVTNYYKDLRKDGPKEIIVHEKVSNMDIAIKEDNNGTSFVLDKIMNGTGIIKDLYDSKVDYILFRENGIDNFEELIKDTKKYIDNGCIDSNYIDKYKILGDYTNFFFKKTIYRVKGDK